MKKIEASGWFDNTGSSKSIRRICLRVDTEVVDEMVDDLVQQCRLAALPKLRECFDLAHGSAFKQCGREHSLFAHERAIDHTAGPPLIPIRN